MKLSAFSLALVAGMASNSLFANDSPYAFWAADEESDAIEFSGSDSVINGMVHSNGGIKIGGSSNRFTGGVNWVSDFDNGGGGNRFSPAAERVDELEWPLSYELSDYAPGGSAALAAGSRYFDLSEQCDDEDKWDVDVQGTELPAGLYWVPCEVVLNASDLSGEISIVSTHTIEVSGSDQSNLSAFQDGILFLTSTDEDLGIKLSGSEMNLTGYLTAENSEVEISCSYIALSCGVYANRIKISGSNIDMEGGLCGVAAPVPNTAPVANNDSVELVEDATVSIALTGTDADGDVLSFNVVSQPVNGTLSGDAPALVYTPTGDFFGSDTFTFIVNDGTEDSVVATVSISVLAVNDAPVAGDLAFTLDEDDSVAITFDGSDVDLDVLTFEVSSQPASGTLTVAGNSATYTPNANFDGIDTFTYVANDGQVNSALATVSLTVLPVNDAPVFNPLSIQTAEDTPVTVTLTAIDADDDALTYSVTTLPNNGDAEINGDLLTYNPNPGFFGDDSVFIAVSDGSLSSDPTLVPILVNEVNTAPTVESIAVSTDVDTPVSIVLMASDTDGDALAFAIERPPTKGTLSGDGANLIYTPNNGAVGADQFLYSAFDGRESSGAASVDIQIEPINLAPIADAGNDASVLFNQLPIALDGSGSSDPENGVLSYQWLVVDGPADAAPMLSDASVSQPSFATDTIGIYTVQLIVSDGELDSQPDTMTLTVLNSVNQAPIADAGPDQSVASDTPVNLTGLASTDPDGDELAYRWSLLDQPPGSQAGFTDAANSTPIFFGDK